VSSGSAALHLALLALGIGAGDEVIVPTMTFCATAHAVVHAGATPVLVDCDRQMFNITADAIAAQITPRTQAIIVVHMCGRCCEMERIMELARQHDLRVIEDCAHAIEAEYHGVPAGTIGDAGCFSFYATKNLTAAEGGMVLTRDEGVATKIRALANNGLSADAWTRYSDEGYQHYAVVEAGFKYNLPDLHAAIGLAQLARLETHATRRAEIWHAYDKQLQGLPCELPAAFEPQTRHARHLYTVLLKLEELSVARDEVLEALTAEGIGSGVHFIPVHQHPFYRKQSSGRLFPNSDHIAERTLSLPLAGDLSDDDISDVCRALRRILLHYAKN
jgi:dTDP-4-amino-4,6-dideoxygalactose transaminase